MYSVSLLPFLIIVVPQFTLVFGIQSQSLYHRLKLTYIVPMVLLATCCSALFSTVGEIVLALLYGLFLVLFKPKGTLFLFAILWELYLISENILALVTQAFTQLIHVNFELITAVFAALMNFGIILAVVICSKIFKRQLDEIARTISSETLFGKAFVFYTGVICVCLYLIQYVFEQMNIAKQARWFTSGIFLIFMIVNLCSLYFINRSIKISLENKMLHESEAAKQQYYADLDLQQSHTEKILHDYKNVIGALQLSLKHPQALDSKSDTQMVLQDAEQTLDNIHPNGSALYAVRNAPLRSLLYLKWTQASAKKIKLNIQSSGSIHISDHSILMSTLRAIGILIDNAIEASSADNEVDVLLVQSSSELAITVINPVPTTFKISTLSQPGYTTKGRGHGHGMQNIQEIIQNNPEINIVKRLLGTKLTITLVVEES